MLLERLSEIVAHIMRCDNTFWRLHETDKIIDY